VPDGEGYWHLVVTPPSGWQSQGSCRGAGANNFFRDERGPYTSLGWAAFCTGCPVRAECLAHAVGAEEQWGVWGGFTPNARRSLLAQLLEGTVTWEQIERALTP
jgi:WhiB family redox-sensing transcriptional regulator